MASIPLFSAFLSKKPPLPDYLKNYNYFKKYLRKARKLTLHKLPVSKSGSSFSIIIAIY
jgi:hypothetical protein